MISGKSAGRNSKVPENDLRINGKISESVGLAEFVILGEATKTRGVNDVAQLVCREMGIDLTEEYAESNKWAFQMFDAAAFLPLVVGITRIDTRSRRYYFWFFGYVAKLPWEREVEVTPGIEVF